MASNPRLRIGCTRWKDASPPFFGEPVEAGGDRGQPLLELESPGFERGMAAIAEGAPDGGAVAADDIGLRITAVLDLPLKGSHPPDPFTPFFLRVPIRFPNRSSRFPQIMELAELMRHVRKDLGYGLP